ncbi:MAG: hypothetical protein IKN77_04260 [Paludibacteraceae bacterium]|nr:hypothetical protein [Paludibacteraceae bacterium]
MKYVNVLVKSLCLLAVFCLISVSCSKDDEEKISNVSFHVDVINNRDEPVLFFYGDDLSVIIGAGKELTGDYTVTSATGYTMVGVKSEDGRIIDKEEMSDGQLYKCVVKKEYEEFDVAFHVDVINLREEAVYVFYEDGSSSIVGAGKEFTTDRTVVSRNIYTTVGVRLSNGRVLDKKDVYDGNVYKLVVNKESSEQEVSDRIDTWSLVIELTNSSSNSVYLFVDGKQTNIVSSGNKLSSMIEITNQSEVSIAVKNASGDVLDSKKVSKKGSYVKEIKDPTFTITKIVLTKWAANNLLDRPDPWMRISYGDNLIGRTDYFPDKTDGSTCTWSDLNIEIKNIYSRIDFDLYDYNLGYSTSGSSFIDGLYTTSFYTHWKSTSFDMYTSSLKFTLYGVWK